MSRSGGMPPLVMIFEGSRAELTDNELTGGGVASIRCAGTVLAEGNVIKPDAGSKGGRGPSSAIWALPGAEVVAHGNEFLGWQGPTCFRGQSDRIAKSGLRFECKSFPNRQIHFQIPYRK